LLLAAALLFLGLGVANTQSVPTWSEEVANLPLAPAGTIDLREEAHAASGAVPERRLCADPGVRVDLAPSRRVRPALAVCAGGREWPVLAASYASSVFGWPIALFYRLLGTSILRLRVVWMLLSGTASLGLAGALVRRLAGDARAAVAVAAVAASSASVFLTALFFPYESFIWIWIAAGCLLLAPHLSGERAATTLRAAAAGACLGLAVLTNVKALFLLVPLAVWAWRERDASRRLGWRWVVVAASALPGPALLLWLAHADPSGGLSSETVGRLGWVSARQAAAIVPELLNAGTFGADTGAFLAATATGGIERGSVAAWLTAACLALCIATAVRRLLTRRGSPLSAACGMLVGTFVVVSALLYRQGISANYSPVFPVFGVAVVSAVHDAVGFLARHVDAVTRRATKLHAAAAYAAIALLGGRTATRVAQQPSLPSPINVGALAEVADAAEAQQGAPVVTVTMMHALTLDSLSDERVHTVQAQDYFDECTRAPRDVDACVRDRWRALLARSAAARFQVLAPTETRPHMHDSERRTMGAIVTALRAEAEAAGRAVRTTHQVWRSGALVMSLYVVEPAEAAR
jgi:hypothetical protein